MPKGQDFERLVCTMLSEWWTDGRRDDVFWRTSGSGARATTRSKAGKSTHASYGDILAVDPIGAPLLKVFTIECKKGYPKASPSELLEMVFRPPKILTCCYMKMLEQAHTAYLAAGSLTWALINRRTGREIMMAFPIGSTMWASTPWTDAARKVPHLYTSAPHHSTLLPNPIRLIQVQLKPFLKVLSPKSLRAFLHYDRAARNT